MHFSNFLLINSGFQFIVDPNIQNPGLTLTKNFISSSSDMKLKIQTRGYFYAWTDEFFSIHTKSRHEITVKSCWESGCDPPFISLVDKDILKSDREVEVYCTCHENEYVTIFQLVLTIDYRYLFSGLRSFVSIWIAGISNGREFESNFFVFNQ